MSLSRATPSLESLRGATAPGLLVARARAEPQGVAYRAMHLGLYRERTWADYALAVARAAEAFAALGVTAGDRVAIMGDVCEEWLIADQAAQALGAVVYGIYPTASQEEVAYQMRDGGAMLFVAEDQEYVDKLGPLIDALPALRKVVVLDESAMFAFAHDKIVGFRSICEAAAGASLETLAARAARVRPDDPAFIVYTSGTTGHPKGALVTHGKHLAATRSVVATYPTLAAREHRTVVYLPICHVLGRDIAVTLPLISWLVPHFGEDPEDLLTSFFEVAPTVLFTVPRYLQKLAASVLVGLRTSSPVKRGVYEAAMAFARGHVRRRWEGRATAADAALHSMWRALVFRPILNKIGFDKLELVVSGGAPLPPETMALWQMWGVNVCEMYGQTETAGGIVSGQRGPFPRPGNVGRVPEGFEIRLDPATGEILVRSHDLFSGYWGNPEATAGVLGADGWLRTGDVGEIVDGNLKLIDRARDFIVTAGGKTISPSYVENAMRAIPYLSEILVIGHGRKYLAALVEIDLDTVADWARSQGIVYTGFMSLAENPAVVKLLEGEIARINMTLARVEQVKAFRILPKVLDPEEEGEPVTPTRKLKRKQMTDRFADLVAQMYDDREERLLAEEVGSAL